MYEVVFMTGEDFWELFAETGEPVCWLLSRALSGREPGENEEETAG